ncbi:MAG: ATP-binding protein [Desulfohalobiaceae bacterium]|nr:ATP-binding protein [Desulfohalobiaceae bacterium]
MPTVYIIAGPNGAGKTTLMKRLFNILQKYQRNSFMETRNNEKQELSLMADAAFQKAMRKVLQKAKLTNSPIVIWEDGQVKEVPPVVIESRLQEKDQRERK